MSYIVNYIERRTVFHGTVAQLVRNGCSVHFGISAQFERNLQGSKERSLQIGNGDVLKILKEYRQVYAGQIRESGFFFPGPSGSAISDQSVRRMINKYVNRAAIETKITPHKFRHTFATSLLDAGVDIRYIQSMLGHSSISVTEIYTHVSTAKQKDILTNKHPRKDFDIQ